MESVNKKKAQVQFQMNDPIKSSIKFTLQIQFQSGQ